MPMVMASNWSMTALPSISPAGKVTLGMVVMFPAIRLAVPCALKKPSALAVMTVYIPCGAVRLKEPSALARVEAINELLGSYRRTVTGLLAKTCPITTGAEEGVGEAIGVGVIIAPDTDKFAGTWGISVKRLSPLETRAVHTTVDCPICTPFKLKVRAMPLVTARLPLLPAIATMNCPFCGLVMAVTASAPNKSVTAKLLASNKGGL